MKPGKRLQSLQARLLAPLLGLLTAVWLGTLLLTWLDVGHELDELLDGHLAQAAALLVMQQSADKHPELIDDTPVLHKYAPRVMFQVFHEGKLVLHSANADTTPISSHGLGFSTERLGDGKQWRIFATLGSENDVQVFVGEMLESRKSILLAVLQGVLGPLAFALPVLALMGWWVVRSGLAPLRKLSLLLGHRQPQALEPLSVDHLPTEMKPMVQALNDLLERVGVMLAFERRFTADAAHELRTPIAGIRAQAQVALGAGDDATQREHALQSTLAGCDRATRLVEQLLTLARLETASTAALSPVDLTQAARRVGADMATTALARQQTIELIADDGCIVTGDDILIGVMLRNLIDNAMRYCPDGASIQVLVRAQGQQVMVCVEDSGPGMTEPELARLGERFFRVLGTAQTGSGLGWSIMKRIAHVYGATLHVGRSTALGGLAVTLLWPTRT